jgi:molybdopterin converting factor small subunit
MSITLYLPSSLHYLAKGQSSFEVKGNTVDECLNHLLSLVPVMKKALFYEKGNRLYPHVKVQVNKEKADAEDLAKSVKDGDEIHILLQRH